MAAAGGNNSSNYDLESFEETLAATDQIELELNRQQQQDSDETINDILKNCLVYNDFDANDTDQINYARMSQDQHDNMLLMAVAPPTAPPTATEPKLCNDSVYYIGDTAINAYAVGNNDKQEPNAGNPVYVLSAPQSASTDHQQQQQQQQLQQFNHDCCAMEVVSAPPIEQDANNTMLTITHNTVDMDFHQLQAATDTAVELVVAAAADDGNGADDNDDKMSVGSGGGGRGTCESEIYGQHYRLLRSYTGEEAKQFQANGEDFHWCRVCLSTKRAPQPVPKGYGEYATFEKLLEHTADEHSKGRDMPIVCVNCTKILIGNTQYMRHFMSCKARKWAIKNFPNQLPFNTGRYIMTNDKETAQAKSNEFAEFMNEGDHKLLFLVHRIQPGLKVEVENLDSSSSSNSSPDDGKSLDAGSSDIGSNQNDSSTSYATREGSAGVETANRVNRHNKKRNKKRAVDLSPYTRNSSNTTSASSSASSSSVSPSPS